MDFKTKYSEVPNRRACSLKFFRFFCHPARKFSACLFNKPEKYFLTALLFCPACSVILQNWLLLTIPTVISSLLVYQILGKTSTLLFYSDLFIIFQKMSACLFNLVYTCIRDFRVNRIVKFGVSIQFCEDSHNLTIMVNKGINMVWVINWPDVCYYPQCTLIISLNRGLYNQKILNQIFGLHACFWMWNWILSCQNLSYAGCKSIFRKIFELTIWKKPMLVLIQMIH